MTPDPADMQKRYRNTFGSEEGRIVLGDILTMTGFGETLPPDNPAKIAEYNVGLTIARMAGALNLIYPQIGIPVKTEE